MDVNLNSVLSANTEYTKGYVKNEDKEKKEETSVKNEAAAVYEKSDSSKDSGTYKINKMSKEDRSALVKQLEADASKRQQSLIDLAHNMISKQANTFGAATDVWKFLASGKFEVDAETKAKAQEDISEDGYYGVKQTSQRLFDFASALAGDDVKTMEKMQKAIEKGYKKAEKTWGGELPEISKKTLEATNKLFDDYYKAKQQESKTIVED